ncbi:MAG TPA: Uma2 family endonuclease [Blastocatellia bacterium]|nr:Uma2 family endonuclease [Blastocatellia bacterium]
MSALTASLNVLPAVPRDPILRLSVQQYHEMIRAGILTADDQVELLEGWLVAKRPKKPQHRIATRLTQKALEAVVPDGWYVDAQEPITLTDSEPEPDVMIVRGETQNYSDRHPHADEIALVVEIADSTLERDRSTKKRMYARAGIPVYWIVNLVENTCEVYSQPSVADADYQQIDVYDLSGALPVLIGGREVGTVQVQD